MPQTFVAVKAGLTLQQFKTPSDVIDLKTIFSLFGLAFLSLLPTWKPFTDRLSLLLNKIRTKQE